MKLPARYMHEHSLPSHGIYSSAVFSFHKKDPKGNNRVWECAFRPTRRSECDGVAVIVFVKYPVSKKEGEILLVSQYRPPVASEVCMFACCCSNAYDASIFGSFSPVYLLFSRCCIIRT